MLFRSLHVLTMNDNVNQALSRVFPSRSREAFFMQELGRVAVSDCCRISPGGGRPARGVGSEPNKLQ